MHIYIDATFIRVRIIIPGYNSCLLNSGIDFLVDINGTFGRRRD